MSRAGSLSGDPAGTKKRLQVESGSAISYFTADVATAQDYYPFGMLMPGRHYTFGSDSAYRYGFNGQENDNEVKGARELAGLWGEVL